MRSAPSGARWSGPWLLPGRPLRIRGGPFLLVGVLAEKGEAPGLGGTFAAIAVISLLVGGIGIMNVLLVAVRGARLPRVRRGCGCGIGGLPGLAGRILAPERRVANRVTERTQVARASRVRVHTQLVEGQP